MRTRFAVAIGLFCVRAVAAYGGDAVGELRQINFVGGIFHGPGHMADSPSPAGKLSHLQLDASLTGRIEFFNNGAAPPNLDSEVKSQVSADGRLSNGRPFNEHTDGGIIEVGRGAMRFLNVTAGDGPTAGITSSYLDADLNWHLIVDLALDPGFAEGLIVIERLDITTGVTQVPPSRQSVAGQLGGTERAGSLASGTPLAGRLGDFDGDGLLDGVFVGATNIPLQHLFMPGAPAVQVRTFVTDIPVTPMDAAVLALTSALNLDQVLNNRPPAAAAATKSKSNSSALDELLTRLDAALAALKNSPQAAQRGDLAELRSHVEKCARQPAAPAQPASCVADLPRIFIKLSEVRSAIAAAASLRGRAIPSAVVH